MSKVYYAVFPIKTWGPNKQAYPRHFHDTKLEADLERMRREQSLQKDFVVKRVLLDFKGHHYDVYEHHTERTRTNKGTFK